MKRLIAVFVVSVFAGVVLFAQASKIISSGTLPRECTNGAIYWKTGASKGLYGCDAGTWQGPYITSASASGIALIEQQTPSGTGTVTFSSLGSYAHLKIIYSIRGTEVATFSTLTMRFNGDSGNNYDMQEIFASNATVGASQGLAGSNIGIAIVPAASAPTGSTGTGEITIADYAGTTLHKGVVNTHQNRRADTSGNFFFSTRVGDWRSTSAVTSVTLALGSGNYAAGSKLTAYGLMQ